MDIGPRPRVEFRVSIGIVNANRINAKRSKSGMGCERTSAEGRDTYNGEPVVREM